MNNTDTVALVAEKMNEIAASKAFEYTGNYGRGTFVHQVSCKRTNDAYGRAGNEIRVYSECNARVSEEQALEQLLAVERELGAWLTAQGIKATVRKINGKRTTRAGFWHMGHFCTSGFCRTIRVYVEAEVAA